MVSLNSAEELEWSVQKVHDRCLEGDSVTLMDIRKPSEREIVALEDDLFLPMEELPERVDEMNNLDEPIVVYCHHGVRSLRVTQYLREEGFDEVYSLAGGIDAWARTIDPELPTY